MPVPPVLSSKYIVAAWGDKVKIEGEGDKLRLVNTKVVMLHQGRIIFEGTDEQFWRSDDPFNSRIPRVRCNPTRTLRWSNSLNQNLPACESSPSPRRMVYPERDALLSCGARGPYRIARDVHLPC